ncbi:MAG: tetratricopeptide repeat protein [Gaiellaceae bacterium]
MKHGSFAPYLPRLVVDWAREGGALGARELEGSLVSLDVSGFTALSERLQAKGRAGAEELVLLVSGVFQGLIGICERHGGDVLKFRGDALLLLFTGESHERRACLAASHMQWLIEETGQTMSSVGAVTLRMSVGIYSGSCAFFLVEGTHRELLVAGPAATATIRLESAAAAGQILASERTAAALDPAWLGQAKDGARLLRQIHEEFGADAYPTYSDSEQELAAYVPEPLRAQLLLEAGEAEHRAVTAAFLEYSGTDALLESEGADALHMRLDALARLTGETVRELGLTWLESDIDDDGGKLYLVGGAPSSTGADEDRMLRALRAIVDGYDELPLRAGVNRGPAFCGDIGAATRRTYAVMGDTVNLAARLTGRAQVGEILATADVLDRARTRFENSTQPFLMKGKELPVTAYLVGAAAGEKEDEAALELPLVGREAELAAFSEAVSAARIRQQRLVELVGDPGIGKSRLVEELKRLAIGFTQLVGRCDQYSSSTPYHVFRSLLRPLAGITDEQSPEDAGVHLSTWVQAVFPDLAPWLPLLAIPLGAEVPPTPESDEIDPSLRRTKLHEVVDQFLTRLLMMPTLLVLEDAHWMDDASRELIRHAAASPLPRPWVVCVTRRPQGGAIAGERAGHVQLELAPLGEAAAEQLALAAAGDVALAQATLTVLTSRSGGNPLFVRELVAAARGGASVDELPDTVETLIVSRIDTLQPEDRFLLRNASVLGARFDLDVLGEILTGELEDVTDLERWERLREFVAFVEPNVLGFLHDLFRLAAYEGLSFRRRHELHARVGAALELRDGEPALLSLHFQNAQDYAKAWRYAVQAGDTARARYANVDALDLYTRALACSEHVALAPTAIARVSEALGDVAELVARYDEAQSAYARARELIGDDVIATTRLLQKTGVLHERRGDYAGALSWYGRGLSALDGSGDTAAQVVHNRVELELAYAGVKHRQGRFEEVVEWALRAAEEAEAAGYRDGLAHAYYLVDIAQTRLGAADRPYRGRALEIYAETGDLIGQSRALNNLGIDAGLHGRWDEALDWYRRCRVVCERAGDVVFAATATHNIGEVLSDQGRLEEAKELFEDSLRVFRAAGYRAGAASATTSLGRLAARAGRFEETHRLLQEALVEFTEIGAHSSVLEASAREAECFVLEGRHKEASTLLTTLLDEAAPPHRATLERLAGYAVVQSRAPLAQAKPHFDASLEAARAADAQYELALTLRAIAETNGETSAEADAILEQLGVVATPSVPLP